MTRSEYQKKYHAENKKKIKKQQRRWRKKNNAHIKTKATEYRKNNPAKIKKWQRRHRAKKKKERKLLDETTKIVCAVCQKEKKLSECKRFKSHGWKICDDCYHKYYKPFSKKYYHAKLKLDPAWVEKNRAGARAYHHDNREEVLKKAKVYRDKPSSKKKMRQYRKKNKKKIHAQEVITKRRYHEKNRDALTDKYITSLFRTQGKLNPSAGQIERKRVEILIFRLTKKINDVSTGKKKICSRCKVPQDLKEFYLIKKTGRRTAHCRTCNSKTCKKYRNKMKKQKRKKISLAK